MAQHGSRRRSRCVPPARVESTTVKTLAGILVPDSGRCEVLGRIPWRDRVAHAARIGVVFGQRTQLAFDPQRVSPAELIRRVTSAHAIRDLFVENPPIETIIARLYEHSAARPLNKE